MTTFELNIGLLVGNDHTSRDNSWLHIRDRLRNLRNDLAGQLSVRMRSQFELIEEPTLIVRGQVSTDDLGGFHQWLYQLAERYGQDCIAVYYPNEWKGYLVGPRADAWGDFQDEYFIRY